MLFAIPNLSSHKAFEVEPWNYVVDIPKSVTASKARYSEWCAKPSTENCHFTVAEGQDPMRRVASDNPLIYLHGLIADYDAKISGDMLTDLRENSPVEFAPNWACLTFSGHGRLVWLFEEPLAIPSPELAKTLLKLIRRKMKLTKFLPGFDEDAFYDPHRYYDRGREWIDICNDCIPTNFVHQWMYEAGNKIKWDAYGIVIPLDTVADKIATEFPGKWSGPFTEGARGTRFWDPMADNSTAAIVRTAGMQCFTGPEPFVPWSRILGPAFVQQFEADRIGSIVADTFYDGTHYWRREDGSKLWQTMTREDFRLRLRVRYELSGTMKRQDTCSEVDRAVYTVQEQKQVEAALPFVHQPSGRLHNNGKVYLNTSSIACMKPSATGGKEWGDGFPWLAEFFDGMFNPPEQLPFFLAWWKHFYCNALREAPRTGQSIFIAGDTGIGKTLLSTRIVSPTVGGFADASSYLLGEEKYTSHIVSFPIMAVDDTAPAIDQRRHARYSSTIKKITANRYQLFEQKFLKAGLVEWLGRIVVTCNLDPESLGLLPSMEISMMDKVCFFRCKDASKRFPTHNELIRILQQELPCLCRYLIYWPVPEHCVGDERFGAASYHDKFMLQASIQTGASFSFLELLKEFLGVTESERRNDTHWVGTSTRLISEMSNDAVFGSLASKYTPNQAATMLGQLRSRGYPIGRERSATQRVWKIPFTGLENTT